MHHVICNAPRDTCNPRHVTGVKALPEHVASMTEQDPAVELLLLNLELLLYLTEWTARGNLANNRLV